MTTTAHLRAVNRRVTLMVAATGCSTAVRVFVREASHELRSGFDRLPHPQQAVPEPTLQPATRIHETED